jgi:hypothetical protein
MIPANFQVVVQAACLGVLSFATAVVSLCVTDLTTVVIAERCVRCCALDTGGCCGPVRLLQVQSTNKAHCSLSHVASVVRASCVGGLS